MEPIVASGDRAAELALRFAYGGLAGDRLEVVPDLERALDRGLELVPPGGELGVLPTYTAMLALRAIATERGLVRPYWEGRVNFASGHLYPDYLNIYADRGNIAVLDRRARLRGHELVVRDLEPGDVLEPASIDLLYIGGGQDREQALIAPDLAAKGEAIRGGRRRRRRPARGLRGYQLLGRGYRGRDGVWLEGAGLFPHETIAGEKRMIGDVLLECELSPGIGRRRRLREPCGPDAARSGCRAVRSRHRRVRERRSVRARGLPRRTAIGTYLHGPLLPRNPWLADWLLEHALEHAGAGAATPLAPLADELERIAHSVSVQRARDRGGRS